MKLAIYYTIFALIATVANIATQDFIIRIYHGEYAIMISVMAGTAIGLMVKYLLDKRYIFDFQARNAMHNARLFLLYSVMGIATTALFWGCEFGFNAISATRGMRYLGAVVGLALGYLSKYRLDKRYVFCREQE